MVAVRSSAGLVDDLESLALALESLDLRTASLRHKSSEATRDQLVRTIRSYVIPRLVDPTTPLCVVFAGPTGSGKSTLINSVSGHDLAETGPIRPTTTEPIVLASDENAPRFETVGGVACAVATSGAPIFDSVALIDTPDIDSTSTEHRAIAEMLVDNADVVVFVTSALRYADLIPWQVLRRAVSRGAPVINVLNRYTSQAAGAYVDFRARLSDEGLPTEVVRVPEHHLSADVHSVPSLAVKELARRLVDVARDRDRYQQEVLDRVLDSTIAQTSLLIESVGDDRHWLDNRETEIHSGFADGPALVDLSAAVDDLTFDFPHGASARKKRRWLRRAPTVIDVTDRVVAMVDADIRSRGLIDDNIREVVANTIPGWHDYAGRVAEKTERASVDLVQAVLIYASLGRRDTEMESLVIGEDSDRLVRRVHRELVNRLQVIYSHGGDRLVDRFAAETGEPQAGDLADRLALVVARSHFADA